MSSVPHIGHLYSATLADATARWQRIKGKDVVFATGTDEHGLKIQKAAQAAKVAPIQFCDGISHSFRDLFSKADISHTDFIRTTEERHKNTVCAFWSKLQKEGHIYKGVYEGWYSVSDEAYLTADQVTDQVDSSTGKTIKVSVESGQPVEWLQEENYKFRLTAFIPDLIKWLDRPGIIQPDKFRNVVLKWLEQGLPDLSVSRQSERLKWGIPVPGDPDHTIYVWLDALVNYLTVLGYPKHQDKWPAQCHVIGKDILKFHAIYWPAFLMAAGLDLPEQIFCHSHWMIDNFKMSKSRGNVVDPFNRIERYTSDGLRYFLLREGVPHSDGNYTEDKLVAYLNSELANTLGNLLSRCTAKTLNPRQVIPVIDMDVFHKRAAQCDLQMWRQIQTLPNVVDDHYLNYNFYKGIDCILAQLRDTNTFIQQQRPWDLIKSDNESDKKCCETVISIAMHNLRVAGILLQPVIPRLADKLLNRLAIDQNQRTFKSLKETVATQNDFEIPLGTMDGVFFSRIRY